MTFHTWEVSKVSYCEHVGHEIALEAEKVYPADNLPDQPARVLARRCSNGLVCNGMNKPGCIWSGTQPDYQPF